MNLNAGPTSSFPIEQINHDHNFDANFQVASSSSSTQDQMGYRQKDDDYAYHGGSLYNYEMKNKVNNGLKLTLWKKDAEKKKNNTVKWMSSKMRLMQNNPKISTSVTNKYFENQSSSTLETDLSTNISSYNNNSPIRVCADCNTTKTPLWRSGPKGPKSLCNACGIRQRKARRAMAAATSGTVVTSDQPPTQTSLKIKVKNNHFKKMASKTSSNGKKKKIDLEDFLINLSNKLTFHCVFPEEEKDAAILLMALSSGLLHG